MDAEGGNSDGAPTFVPGGSPCCPGLSLRPVCRVAGYPKDGLPLTDAVAAVGRPHQRARHLPRPAAGLQAVVGQITHFFHSGCMCLRSFGSDAGVRTSAGPLPLRGRSGRAEQGSWTRSSPKGPREQRFVGDESNDRNPGRDERCRSEPTGDTQPRQEDPGADSGDRDHQAGDTEDQEP
jgi:hypothetical protein